MLFRSGILGILKAGGAYLPLDPSNPPERSAYILKDAQVNILITQSFLPANLASCDRVIYLDQSLEQIQTYPVTNPDQIGQIEDLAHVIMPPRFPRRRSQRQMNEIMSRHRDR